MTDVEALKTAIKDAGISIVFLAEKLGCSRNRVYSIMRGADITTSEIVRITQILHLTTEERDAIFFANVGE